MPGHRSVSPHNIYRLINWVNWAKTFRPEAYLTCVSSLALRVYLARFFCFVVFTIWIPVTEQIGCTRKNNLVFPVEQDWVFYIFVPGWFRSCHIEAIIINFFWPESFFNQIVKTKVILICHRKNIDIDTTMCSLLTK